MPWRRTVDHSVGPVLKRQVIGRCSPLYCTEAVHEFAKMPTEFLEAYQRHLELWPALFSRRRQCRILEWDIAKRNAFRGHMARAAFERTQHMGPFLNDELIC